MQLTNALTFSSAALKKKWVLCHLKSGTLLRVMPCSDSTSTAGHALIVVRLTSYHNHNSRPAASRHRKEQVVVFPKACTYLHSMARILSTLVGHRQNLLFDPRLDPPVDLGNECGGHSSRQSKHCLYI
jgi:hypothetical protein